MPSTGDEQNNEDNMSPIIKKKGEKITIPAKYILFVRTILGTALILLTLYTDRISRPLSEIAGRLIIPMQAGISRVGSYLSNRTEELGYIRDLLAENERLRDEIDQLTIENALYKQDRYELASLRALFELDALYEDYEKVGARIIARDPGNWFHSFTIDKGWEDGLMVDMNVMAGSGLAGRIVKVGPNWAKVTTIIADNSNVSGKVLSTEDNLIVRGNRELYAEGVVVFEQLIDNADRVTIGDRVVTSNISDKYLPGILIGYITPVVDFEYMSEVLVILQLKQSIEEED
jgi:rod shape-determining protein MreC